MGPDPPARMPTGLLPETRLHEPVQAPPVVVPVAPPTTTEELALPAVRFMPLLPLGIAAAPVTSVPTKLPVIVVTLVSVSAVAIPFPVLPETRFPAMVELGEPGVEICTPTPLGIAAVPAALVPILFALTVVFDPKQPGAQN